MIKSKKKDLLKKYITMTQSGKKLGQKDMVVLAEFKVCLEDRVDVWVYCLG